MKIKIWVISSLLLLVTLTGLAQSYHQVINRSLDSDLNEKKVTTENKKGTIFIGQNHLQIDDVYYKLIEKQQEHLSKDYRFEHYVIWNLKDKSQRTYSCVLSYDIKSSRLLMVEIWKSRFNCVYYVLSKEKNHSTVSSINSRTPSHPWSRVRVNNKNG